MPKKLARALIMQALSDLKKNDEENKRDALAWFNRRDTKAAGYGWCLHYSEMNPNIIRKYINEFTGQEKT